MIGFVGVFSPAVLLHKCVDSHHIYRVCAITRLVRSHILKGTPICFQHYHAGYGRDRLTYTRVHGRQSFFGISSSLNFYLSRRLPRNSSAKSWLPFSLLGVLRSQCPELPARWYCLSSLYSFLGQASPPCALHVRCRLLLSGDEYCGSHPQ